MKISGRVEGTAAYLAEVYGLENLELAYNDSGTYLGFGWKKGTLEYLEKRREAGERIDRNLSSDAIFWARFCNLSGVLGIGGMCEF